MQRRAWQWTQLLTRSWNPSYCLRLVLFGPTVESARELPDKYEIPQQRHPVFSGSHWRLACIVRIARIRHSVQHSEPVTQPTGARTGDQSSSPSPGTTVRVQVISVAAASRVCLLQGEQRNM